MGSNMNGRLLQLMAMVEPTHWSSSYWIITVCIWSFQLFELYLHVRQKRFYNKAQLPAFMTPETFERARQYSLNKIYFEMISRLYRMVMLTVFLHFKYMALFFEFLVEIPLILYFFVILEEKHGFNNDQFFSDLTVFGNSIKGNVLSKWFPILEPFYSNQSPLKAGPLRSRLEALATRLGFPVDRLCVRDVSYRTKHAGAALINLFFYKRVFIDDTLLQRGEEKGLNEEEIEAVVAHELSHWKLKHAEKSVFIFVVVICLRSYLFDYLNQTLGLDGVSIIVDVLQTAIVLGYLRKVLSRTVEFQADAYAIKLGYGKPLKSALIKLCNNSLRFPKSDPLFSAWDHSHPTIVERLAAIDLLMRKTD